MGVDLKLLPMQPGCNSSRSILEVERRGMLWEPIGEIQNRHGRDVPQPFYSYASREGGGEPHYGDTQQTPYGDRVKMVKAKHLLTLSDHPAVQDNPLNRAVWAWLNAIEPETDIALFWH